MTKRNGKKIWRKSAAAILVLVLTAGLWGCGGSADKAKETEAKETAAAETTIREPINPEEVKSEDIIREEEKPAAAATQNKTEKEPEKETEKEVIEKPEPSAESEQPAKKEESKKEEKKADKAAYDLNEVLDGHMVFDGMDLQFPIELSAMKLGSWTITYELEGDPADKTLAYQEVVMAKMTNPAYTDNDVIVMAEFGNYTGSEAALTDLPLTGLYITKGKGTDGAEPRLPSLELPCGFTWGTPESEIHEKLGEPSLSGSFDYEFDGMYENGQYLIELAGMNESGLEYVVYSVE